jgi:hypothetical protein
VFKFKTFAHGIIFSTPAAVSQMHSRRLLLITAGAFVYAHNALLMPRNKTRALDVQKLGAPTSLQYVCKTPATLGKTKTS